MTSQVATFSETLAPPPLIPSSGEKLPQVVWVTVALFLVSLVTGVASTVAALNYALPMWAAVFINAVVSYLMFTVAHDASHHSLGRSGWVNSLLGHLSTPFVLSHMSFPFWRYVHIEHHRCANEETGADPDTWTTHAPRWQLLFRWLTIDVAYFAFWIRNGRYRMPRELWATLILFALEIVLVAWAVQSGNLMELLLLVYLPQRIAICGLACAFSYLPHNGLKVAARENEYKATRMRIGMEWLLTPVLLSQNYHLIHHLHPSLPFYRYLRVWRRNAALYLRNGSELSTVWGEPIAPGHYAASHSIAMPPPQQAPAHRTFHALTVSQVERLTPDSVEITLAVPAHLKQTFAFRPGQHITLQREIGGGLVRRNYSICIPPHSGDLRIGIRHVAGGVFSSYATSQIAAGDLLEVFPPSGGFFAEPIAGRSKRYGAVAAGSGITPVLSIIASTLEVEKESSFLLLFGNRDVQSIMFLDALRALQARHGQRLEIRHYLSQVRTGAAPVPESGLGLQAQQGMITQEVLAACIQEPSVADISDWYLCGPQDLMATARVELSRANHRTSDQALPTIHQEVFGSALSGAAVQDGAKNVTERKEACRVRLVLGSQTTEFVMPPNRETVLEAAMRLRRDIPYSCMGGACGTCRAKVSSGSVSMAQNHVLSDDEVEQGYVLCCQSRPTSTHLAIDFDKG